jgi:hypothetical protein
MQKNDKFRNLANYIRQHPKASGARTLTEARRLAFGSKKSQHGMLGKAIMMK